MIQISCTDSYYAYDAYHITRAFYPDEEIKQLASQQEPLVKITMPGGSFFSFETRELEEIQNRKLQKNQVNQALFRFLEKESGRSLPWGILTGIRPTKIAMAYGSNDAVDTPSEVEGYLQSHYMVSKEKAELCVEIANREKILLDRLDYAHGYSVYVGIPFCPSRCAYCSFPSYEGKDWETLIDPYLSALEQEIRETASKMGDASHVDTIYMGGGTPTTLSPAQMDKLLSMLEETFSYTHLQELTVEAGRPDSITREKLQILKDHHIDRISINPQTMQQKTLDIIGRLHSVQAVREAFYLAREMGFSNINMDLIAGLPEEGLSEFADTLEQIGELNPDSLTVHSLAVKRSSKLGQGEVLWNRTDGKVLSQMIDMGRSFAKEQQMVPYYMYRQKNMAGNFENTGYAKVDKAGIYNILIMEEKQSILAFGAGASSKIVRKEPVDGKRILRIENMKDVPSYMEHVSDMVKRKGELLLWH